MTVYNWTYTDLDDKIAKDVQGFLPDRIFDIHAHIYRVADLNLSQANVLSEGPQEVTLDVWRERMGKQVGKLRLQGGLFFPVPAYSCDVEKLNEFLLTQLEKAPGSKGLAVISPESSRNKIAEYLKNPGICGFKPYHVFSKEKPTFQASLASYLPEWAWEMAERHGLVIMLHMVKDLALADSGNQREIRTMCLKHPHVKLILAHAGRGFNALKTVNGLPGLKGLQNVWFDTAAICEPASIIAILREFGPHKILWGSDFPVSETRGRSVTVGDGFVWLQPDTVYWDRILPMCRPILVGIESLRAIREAADRFCLNAQDLQDIFCDNALRLLGIKSEEGTRTCDLYKHAKQRIPGGTQVLSKRPELMAPGQWPAYFLEARGCETWDLDRRHYYDMSSSGVGSCLLGFRDPDINRAVQRRINLGSMCSLNPPEEVELADLLCEIHPWAEQVRFARTGGETASAAVRIARATTDRSLVAVCGYHGWHDWYLAANLGKTDALRGHLLPGLEPLGVPRELRGTSITFKYNSREEFQSIMDKYGNRLAAVIMEPCRNRDPEPGFLDFVRDRAHKLGAVLIFDEITIGWRLHFGGAHLRYGVNPDIAIFSKALGNGYPIGAVIGTKEAMAGAHSSFISSTFWTESVGPVAALAAIRKMQQVNVPAHVARMGTLVKGHWQRSAEKHKLPVVVGDGFPCLSNFRFEHEGADELRTLYTQLMLERGFLAGGGIYPNLAHTEEIVSLYGTAIDEVFGEIADAIAAGDVKARLRGPVAHSGFKRLT
jgi:glutamate-1-semialdehyde 2,1-aminomutase